MKPFIPFFSMILLLYSCTAGHVEFSHLDYKDTVHSRIDVGYEIDWPKSGDRTVCNSIREWISESLGGTYEGKLSDRDSLLSHYANENIQYIEKISGAANGQKTSYSCAIHAADNQPGYITMVKDVEEDAGGAHPFGNTTGATFRKSDGRRFSMDMFRKEDIYGLQAQIRDSLENYFSRIDTISLSNILDESEDLPLPANPPYIIDGKIIFQYQEYEIGGWSRTRPRICFDRKDIDRFLTVTAKHILDGDK